MENNKTTNMNTPPFRIGQKVVRIGATIPGIVIKGEHYTVSLIEQCAKCGDWKISCLEFPKPDSDTPTGVCLCGGRIKSAKHFYLGHASKFAPIEESRTRISYVAVSESLRQTAVEIAAVETN